MIELPFLSPLSSAAFAAFRSVPRQAAGEEAGQKRSLRDMRGFFQGGFRRNDDPSGAGRRCSSDGIVGDMRVHRRTLSKIRLFLRERATESIGAVAAGIGLSFFASVAIGDQADDLAIIFRGMTLDGVYGDGALFSETYFEDGRILYRDANSVDSGEWSVEDGLFCTFYRRQQGACFLVERDGENCFIFFEPVTKPEGGMAPRKDWTSRGWDRKRPSTCPELREAVLDAQFGLSGGVRSIRR